jgi:hypothetical protein
VFKFLICICVMGSGILVGALLGASSAPPIQQQSKAPATSNEKPVRILRDFVGHGGILDEVMTLSVTIRNDHDYPVKDFNIRCVHFGKSGTRLGSNRITVYDQIAAHSTIIRNQIHVGIFDPQTFKSSCDIDNYLRART